ncbi:hypothetical protein HJC23_001276 [Cyclotella cryptica]|uniref:Uncharacterized protein n=1 Tax=Cyclotella cryptica TaxID=29204 RepID=A0ABD3PDK0_9STRA
MENLIELTYLSISGNNPTGSLLTWTENSIELTYLHIAGYQVTGSLPSWMWNLIKLTNIHIADNPVTGSLPYSIGYKLTGSLPSSIGNWYNKLTLVSMWSNLILPTLRGSLTKLTYLDISDNQFTGTLPTLRRH